MSGVATPDPVREAFEHWFSEGGKHPKAVERQGEGYRLAHGQSSWNAWKAAHAALSHPADPLRLEACDAAASVPKARIDPMQDPMRPTFCIGKTADETPAEQVLRKLACWLGVGGYNAPTVDAELFHAKIVDGINDLMRAPSPAPTDPRDTASADEVLIAIKRPKHYETEAPERVVDDAVGLHDGVDVGFEWRIVEPSPAPAPHATQESTRQDERDAAHERMRHAGTMLSNCAFNLAQSDTLDEPTKKTLDKCRREWDEALRAAMSSTPGAQP